MNWLNIFTMLNKPEIEMGIPIPPKAQRSAYKYPWAQLKIGESFMYVGNPRAAYPHAKKQSERLKRTFYAASVGEGRVRVWRIA